MVLAGSHANHPRLSSATAVRPSPLHTLLTQCCVFRGTGSSRRGHVEYQLPSDHSRRTPLSRRYFGLCNVRPSRSLLVIQSVQMTIEIHAANFSPWAVNPEARLVHGLPRWPPAAWHDRRSPGPFGAPDGAVPARLLAIFFGSFLPSCPSTSCRGTRSHIPGVSHVVIDGVRGQRAIKTAGGLLGKRIDVGFLLFFRRRIRLSGIFC